MDPQEMLNLLLQYRYWILIPLAFFEGPLTALALGFLVYLGFFSLAPVYILLVVGDLIPDGVYYWIGHVGNKKRFFKNQDSWFSFINEHLPALQHAWEHHTKKTMLLTKLAYGISTPLLISAGLVKLPIKKFFSHSISISIIQYGIMLSVGYYLGSSYKAALPYIENIGWIITVGAIIAIIGYILIQRYARNQILKMEDDKK